MVLIIPPGRPFTPFEKLIYPFKTTVWLSLITVLISVVIIVAFYNRNHRLSANRFKAKFRISFIDIMIIVVGGSQKRLPTRSHARLILVTFLVFTLVVRGMYLGAMFKFLHNDKRQNDINSVDDMIANKFDFYMYPAFQQFFKDMNFYTR